MLNRGVVTLAAVSLFLLLLVLLLELILWPDKFLVFISRLQRLKMLTKLSVFKSGIYKPSGCKVATLA